MDSSKNNLHILAHLSRRLIGELIVYQWLRRPSVLRPSTFLNVFSSERISSDKASNLPKRDVRFILLKWRLEKLGTLNKYI